MKKIMLCGRSTSGKTTLTQVLHGKHIEYNKTQYVKYGSVIIDTPGEYLEDRHLGYAIALYAYEADVVGLVCAADEPYSLYSPGCASQVNREVIGIITKIDKPNARLEQVRLWLEIAGCKKIFYISSYDGEGVQELLDYLMEGGSASANSFEEAVDFNR
jgi:ethanolamine utilization protein EutP